MNVSLLLSAVLLSQAPATASRWALVLGENRGVRGEETLRFAETDAAKFKDALVDVGGFEASHVRLLRGADASQVRDALAALKAAIAGAGAKPERVLIFASSHASDGSLHLNGTELALSELLDFIKGTPAGVGLLIVDACRSGAVTREKGLKPSTASLPVRVEATGLEGRVFISASGVDEFAQESDSLGGSFFAHHLIAGLRGAADVSGDGKVTLDEAYTWAWTRTLQSTFGSRGGVQHPHVKVDLSGQGELVLSEPGASAGRLVLDVHAPGRWLISSLETGTVVAELEKAEGAMTLAVPPGRYRVQLRGSANMLERTIQVPATGGAFVRGDDLEAASYLRVAAKGEPEGLWVLSLGGGLASSFVGGVNVTPGLELRIRKDAYLWGPINQLVLGLSARDSHALGLTSFRQSEFELRVGPAHRFSFAYGTISLGIEVGTVLVLQNDLPDGSHRVGMGPVACAQVEGRVPLFGPVEVFLSANGGGALLKKVPGLSVNPRLGANAGLAVVF